MATTMKIVLTCALVAVFVASAEAASFNPYLGRMAREGLNAARFSGEHKTAFTTKPVYVRCFGNREFDMAASSRFGGSPSDYEGLIAYASRSSKTVNMRVVDCDDAFDFIEQAKQGRMPDKWDVFSYSTLLHEALHVQGVRNERNAECLANDAVRWAGRVLGLSNRQADKASRMAFDRSAKLAGSEYQNTGSMCQSALGSKDWTMFVSR